MKAITTHSEPISNDQKIMQDFVNMLDYKRLSIIKKQIEFKEVNHDDLMLIECSNIDINKFLETYGNQISLICLIFDRMKKLERKQETQQVISHSKEDVLKILGQEYIKS